MRTARTSGRPNRVSPHKNLTKAINERINELRKELIGLDLPVLDSNICDNCNNQPLEITDAIIAHRIVKYFEIPTNANAAARRQLTVDEWHADEERVRNTPYLRIARHLYGSPMRTIGRTAMRMLKDPSFLDLVFTPGESFNSQSGKISLPRKLDPTTHSVTIDNRALWVDVIASVRGLYKPYLDHWFHNVRDKYAYGYAKSFSKKRIINEVIDTLPNYLVRGSRQAFVDKDNEKDRSIEINPFGDICLQAIVGRCLREAIRLEAGIDLDNAQQVHRELLQHSRFCTIDESRASDSIVKHHVQIGFDKKLADLIVQLSQEYILIENDFGVKVYYPQNKLCSMGSGFTFELLTIINYSVTKKYSPEAYVYGDDVICLADKANQVISALKDVGFIINENKSFVHTPLVESCGAFYIHDFGYVTTYKMRYSNNIVEGIAQINKLSRMVEFLQRVNPSSQVLDKLQETVTRLLEITPAELHGPRSYLDDLPPWVENPKWMYRKKKNKACRLARTLYNVPIEALAYDLQYAPCQISPVTIPMAVNEVDIPRKSSVKWSPLIYSYLYTNRCMKFERKLRVPMIVYKTVLVHEEGYLL